MTAHSLGEARQRRDAIRVAVERGSGGGHDGDLPPDDPWMDRVAKLEVNAGSLVVMTKELLDKVDSLSATTKGQSDEISALVERVATMERRLRHIPSIWSMLAGQVLTACTVAGLLIAAFDHGWTIAKSPAQTTQSTLSRSDDAGRGERTPTGGEGRGGEPGKAIMERGNQNQRP